MDFQQFYENWVETQIDNHSLKEAYQYVLFPPGKLFRPLLFLNLLEDNGLNPQDYYETAVGLELHHSYTLVHDDLPCMDDDDMRRGRPSAHKKFNEWKAILIGDGLLNLSYQAFDSRLVKPFSMLLGPNGLIQGQVFDLDNKAKNFEEFLRIHELKTSRLIQACTIASDIINENSINDSLKFGLNLGLSFQLLDDLSEFESMSNEEEKRNLFIQYPEKAIKQLKQSLRQCLEYLTDKPKSKTFVLNYLSLMRKKISNLPKELLLVLLILDDVNES